VPSRRAFSVSYIACTRQVAGVLQLRAGTTQHDGRLELSGNRLQLRSGLDADEHDAVDAGVEISQCAADSILDAMRPYRAGAAQYNQVRILPAGKRGFHFADPFRYLEKLGAVITKSIR
jgi:hypothetical protein